MALKLYRMGCPLFSLTVRSFARNCAWWNGDRFLEDDPAHNLGARWGGERALIGVVVIDRGGTVWHELLQAEGDRLFCLILDWDIEPVPDGIARGSLFAEDANDAQVVDVHLAAASLLADEVNLGVVGSAVHVVLRALAASASPVKVKLQETVPDARPLKADVLDRLIVYTRTPPSARCS